MASPYKSDRAKAWRNLMVSTINAALDRKLIGLKEGENWGLVAKQHPNKGRPSDGEMLIDFELADLPVTGWLADIGWGELAVHVAVLPKHPPVAGCMHSSHMFHFGEAYAAGWLERRLGPWIMNDKRGGSTLFACRRHLLPVLAGLDLTPTGYEDRGKFII